jgi:hypothetical protein
MTNDHFSQSLTAAIETPTGHDAVVARSWAGVIARLFAPSLDAKLAGGTHPAENPRLAARAQQLATPSYRRGIADSWLDLLIEVRRARTLFDPSVPLIRSHVFAAEAHIRALADALVSPLPTVRGLAMSVAVLRDGSGPLFNTKSDTTLTASIERIIAALNPLTALAEH